MIERENQRVQQAVTDMVDEMDKTHLRKMQFDMHMCAAKCCQDTNASVDTVQRCVERCSTPLVKAQKYVQHELSEFQSRLQRCIMQCNDDIKIQMPVEPSESEIAKYSDQFDRCAIKCVDKHVNLIPNMMKTMKLVLAKDSKGIPNINEFN